MKTVRDSKGAGSCETVGGGAGRCVNFIVMGFRVLAFIRPAEASERAINNITWTYCSDRFICIKRESHNFLPRLWSTSLSLYLLFRVVLRSQPLLFSKLSHHLSHLDDQHKIPNNICNPNFPPPLRSLYCIKGCKPRGRKCTI